jgi:hypothetical protein
MRAPIDAVARGEIDVAIVWGPIAGYFVRNADVPLVLSALLIEYGVPPVADAEGGAGTGPDYRRASHSSNAGRVAGFQDRRQNPGRVETKVT